MFKKPSILFVYYMEPEIQRVWNDGLRAAITIIDSSKDFRVELVNLCEKDVSLNIDRVREFDFVLGWGGFNSPVDKFLYQIRLKTKIPFGLCVGGNAFPPRQDETYQVLFYETPWYKEKLEWHKNARLAFGINSGIFSELADNPLDTYDIYDYVSVGSFSNWKRHHKIMEKSGDRLVIGQIQKNNLNESMAIAYDLVTHGVAVSDMVKPEKLALIFNMTDTVFVPADINGGGERVLLEARACGAKILIEPDNPKLESLINLEDVPNEDWYASVLTAGIKSCLN